MVIVWMSVLILLRSGTALKLNSSMYTALYHSFQETGKVQIQEQISKEHLLSCPPWSEYEEGTCNCINITGDPLKCRFSSNKIRTYILDCYCATYNEESGLVEVGLCQYNCARYSSNQKLDLVYEKLPINSSAWNSFLCGEFKRTGTLCGKCDEVNGYYPYAYSFNYSCSNCSDTSFNKMKYIAYVYMPLTIFYLIIFFLRVDIHSSQLQGFIFFSQFISVPFSTQNLLLASRNKPIILKVTKFVGTLYGVWNLDFFRTYNNICFQVSSLTVLGLNIITALYPFCLMLFTFIMISLYDRNFFPLILIWKPFQILFGRFYRNWSFKTSLVNAFAAFVFLGNIKLLILCSNILIPVQVYQLSSPNNVTISWRLRYDQTIVYFSSEHRPFALIAIVILIVAIIFPTAFFTFYSTKWFQKLINLLPPQWQIFLHSFVDSILGCYKNGTEPGSRDCRWYASLLYISRPFVMVVYAITLNATFFPLGSISLTIVVMITILVDPFNVQSKHLSPTVSIFILFVSVFFVCAAGADITITGTSIYIFYGFAVVVSFLPLLYVSVLVLQWILKHWKERSRRVINYS